MRTLVSSAVYAALGVLFLAIGTVRVEAQSFQGGVRGTVRDAQGVVPGATVELINPSTKATRDTQTNAVGEYSVAVHPSRVVLKSRVDRQRAYGRQ